MVTVSGVIAEQPAGGVASAPELAVIVPTRNERDNIAPLVARLAGALSGMDWEVIFVDDDSPDGTAAAVRSLAVRDTHVRLIERIGRRGLSSACVEGMLASTAPCLAVMDADLQHDETLLPRMVRHLRAGDFDVVVASRYVAGGNTRDFPSRRERLSRLAVRLAHASSRVKLEDPMSGYFVIRREAFEPSVRRLSQLGFKILFDILASSPRPLRCLEVPCRFDARRRGASKLDTLTALQFGALILDKLIGRVVPVTLILFLCVGATGLVVHLAALYALLAVRAPFPAAQSGAVLLAMTSNFLLNNLITYSDLRLRGRQFLRGLLSFYLVCSIGAVANVSLASLIYREWRVWWVAGTAGAALGAAWNYMGSRLLTWRQPLRGASRI
jgi:dolichol-phosphate mannosyltransferase